MCRWPLWLPAVPAVRVLSAVRVLPAVRVYRPLCDPCRPLWERCAICFFFFSRGLPILYSSLKSSGAL